MTNQPAPELLELEIRLLMEGIYEHYGCDFRDYSKATLKRLVSARVAKEGLGSITALLDKTLHDRSCFDRLAGDLSISVSTMFRDPSFFKAIHSEVFPMLRTYPFIRIWHAGCGRGEEVYSMAILLHEAGLYDRCRIYATDMNQQRVEEAQRGVYPLKEMQEYTRNYQAAGGEHSFSAYYTARYGNAIFRSWLKENIHFAQHNLVTESTFNEFNLIVCRNVLIYFNRPLKKRIHELFVNSLAPFGFLALGRQESIGSYFSSPYEVINIQEKIYRGLKSGY